MAVERIIVITGTRKGIGEALAKFFLAKGHWVLGCSRSFPDWTKGETFPKYQHYIADVSDEAAIKTMFAGIRERFGRVDYLINNAGVASMNHALLTPMATFHRLFDTNVAGAFLCAREAAKLMRKKQFGRIVNFSTMAVPIKLQGEAVYAASKAAVVMLTQVLAKEFAEYGITVNAVGPVPVKTDLIRGVSEGKMARLLERQAIKRYGTYADIANVIDFFLREESSFVTGQVIYLGGV
ncbi:MAG: SDR family NAD(P)-dependent oxidoreductase [Schwartzia sp. (in: firmicutes)]